MNNQIKISIIYLSLFLTTQTIILNGMLSPNPYRLPKKQKLKKTQSSSVMQKDKDQLICVKGIDGEEKFTQTMLKTSTDFNNIIATGITEIKVLYPISCIKTALHISSLQSNPTELDKVIEKTQLEELYVVEDFLRKNNFSQGVRYSVLSGIDSLGGTDLITVIDKNQNKTYITYTVLREISKRLVKPDEIIYEDKSLAEIQDTLHALLLHKKMNLSIKSIAQHYSLEQLLYCFLNCELLKNSSIEKDFFDEFLHRCEEFLTSKKSENISYSYQCFDEISVSIPQKFIDLSSCATTRDLNKDTLLKISSTILNACIDFVILFDSFEKTLGKYKFSMLLENVSAQYSSQEIDKASEFLFDYNFPTELIKEIRVKHYAQSVRAGRSGNWLDVLCFARKFVPELERKATYVYLPDQD